MIDNDNDCQIRVGALEDHVDELAQQVTRLGDVIVAVLEGLRGTVEKVYSSSSGSSPDVATKAS